jgi:hyperosmotically inducible protein
MKMKISVLSALLCLGLSTATMTLFTGCASDRYGRSIGEYKDDKFLAAHVRSALDNDPEYKFSDVKVDAYRGTVQLSGFVNTADEKTRANNLARSVPGSPDVVNNINLIEIH